MTRAATPFLLGVAGQIARPPPTPHPSCSLFSDHKPVCSHGAEPPRLSGPPPQSMPNVASQLRVVSHLQSGTHITAHSSWGIWDWVSDPASESSGVLALPMVHLAAIQEDWSCVLTHSVTATSGLIWRQTFNNWGSYHSWSLPQRPTAWTHRSSSRRLWTIVSFFYALPEAKTEEKNIEECMKKCNEAKLVIKCSLSKRVFFFCKS